MNHDAQFNLDRHEAIRECQTAYAYLAKRPYKVLQKNALWGAMGHLSDEIKRLRQRIADDCAPWFDGSAFRDGAASSTRRCKKCGGCETPNMPASCDCADPAMQSPGDEHT